MCLPLPVEPSLKILLTLDLSALGYKASQCNVCLHSHMHTSRFVFGFANKLHVDLKISFYCFQNQNCLINFMLKILANKSCYFVLCCCCGDNIVCVVFVRS